MGGAPAACVSKASPPPADSVALGPQLFARHVLPRDNLTCLLELTILLEGSPAFPLRKENV
jgi:hypothetical protein